MPLPGMLDLAAEDYSDSTEKSFTIDSGSHPFFFLEHFAFLDKHSWSYSGLLLVYLGLRHDMD